MYILQSFHYDRVDLYNTILVTAGGEKLRLHLLSELFLHVKLVILIPETATGMDGMLTDSTLKVL